jgi:hypothetical protein
LVTHSDMPFERLLLLAARQADEVIFANRPAHRNSRLLPYGYGLRWVADLRQTACHRSDNEFEFRGRHSVGRDVCRNNLCSQLQKVAPVQRLAHCIFRSNERDGATIVSSMHDSDTLSSASALCCSAIPSYLAQIAYGGNPVTRWMAANVAVAQDPAGNLKPAKDKSTERIDGIVAAIMAIGRALVAQDEPQPEYSMFFV